MTRFDYVIAHLGIFFVLGGSVAAMAFKTEAFPFSNYPMYSRPSALPLALGKVFGVIREEGGAREVALDSAATLFPFSDRTLRASLNTVLAERGRDAAAIALRDQLAVYNARLAEHGGPHLDGLRFYSMVMDRDPDGELTVRRGDLLVEAGQP
jgi:hypothetical protein